MLSALDLVNTLTDQNTKATDRRELTKEFAHKFGWKPNEFVDTRSSLTTANLLVEQGLDNSAVLSFLPSDRRVGDIQYDERRAILGLSYNNLVDWHVWIDRESVGYFYNRNDSPKATLSRGFDRDNYSVLTKEVFEQAIEHAPNPNIPSLDGALLEAIDRWRRILRSEFSDKVSNADISALFNAIMFARAVEDFHFRMSNETTFDSLSERIAKTNVNIPDAIEQSIVERTRSPVSGALLDRSVLDPFESLPKGLQIDLMEAFYTHPSVPYPYDFSVMSKHALSRIYERYIAVMQRDESIQFSMFPSEPEETWNRLLGGIYTPQYIASFFVRFLKSELSTERFINSSIIDPACGSGIFLRRAMEEKVLASNESGLDETAIALSSLMGIDIDENAVAASKLSLALLHLAACGDLPRDVPIHHNDSLDLLSPTSECFEQTFDAVMMNPPFVHTELQPASLRNAIVEHVGFAAKGKLDIYLAFVAMSIRILRPGGFGFFVLPQSFLASDNLIKLRNWIRDEAWVRLIADLSAIRVFQASVYVVLLIIQRKPEEALEEPPVALIHCKREVGLALEDYLDRRHRNTSSYSMFEVSQSSLNRSTWTVNSPHETNLLTRLEGMPRLKAFAVVRQGVITGADDVFVVGTGDVPSGEEPIYRPFLPERLITRFKLPEESGFRVLYPFVDNRPVSAGEMESDFPDTWRRLKLHETKLSSRKSVGSGRIDWWRLVRPRRPNEMLSAKVVVPKVFLLPRFGLDIDGKWVISHSPFVRVREEDAGQETVLVLTAILNSSLVAWFVGLNARKFRRQYNELTVSLLNKVPIPDLNQTNPTTLQRVVELTEQLMSGSEGFDRQLAVTLDNLVLREMYLLSEDEIGILTS